jgi:hypothetical protein
VEPAKRTGEDSDKFAEPITTAPPQGDNLGTASLTEIEGETHKPQSHKNPKRDKVPNSPTPGTSSKQHVEILMKNLGNRKRKGESNDEHSRPTTAGDDTTLPTAIEEGTHNLQTQTASTGEVWQSQRNPKSNETPHSPTPGTSSKQQIEALKETLGNRKRKRGSDSEHLRDTPEAGSIDEFWQSQKNPTSNTVPNSPSPGNSSKQQVETIIEPNDTTSRPDTSKCIQVGSNTFVLRTQPETPSTQHVEESIVFYDSSQTKKRRLSSGIRKRMKFHPP